MPTSRSTNSCPLHSTPRSCRHPAIVNSRLFPRWKVRRTTRMKRWNVMFGEKSGNSQNIQVVSTVDDYYWDLDFSNNGDSPVFLCVNPRLVTHRQRSIEYLRREASPKRSWPTSGALVFRQTAHRFRFIRCCLKKGKFLFASYREFGRWKLAKTADHAEPASISTKLNFSHRREICLRWPRPHCK